MASSRHGSRARGSAGFTYIGVLLLVAFTGAALAGIGEAWHTTVQRAKEADLLFIGDEFRKAIDSYYDGTPGPAKQFPGTLADLLLDRRFPTTRRHLRKIYVDPMTGKSEWGLVKGPGDTIMGVHSLSLDAPFKHADFPAPYAAFSSAKTYADWRFTGGATNAPAAPLH